MSQEIHWNISGPEQQNTLAYKNKKIYVFGEFILFRFNTMTPQVFVYLSPASVYD